jgi:SagB-type dehydrogenase family enzyme
MRNRDTSVADRYWQDTFYESAAMLARGVGSEGSAEEPLKFKAYRGQPRRPLPQRTSAGLGSLGGEPDGEPDRDPDGDPAAAAPDDGWLGSLLFHGYGFSRQDVGAIGGWPYHRLVPSARCFYPTELYVLLPGGGAYHYDQLHHGLVELRPYADLDVLGQAIGAPASDCAAVLVLTSHYWKTAFRYRDYAYRLCSQEAGMVAGNLLLVAGGLGLRGAVHYQFLDAVVDRMLGLPEGRERTVAVLPLRRGAGAPVPRPAAAAAADLLARVPEIAPRFLEVVESRHLAQDTYRMDAGSVLESTAEFTGPLPASPAGGGTPLPLIGGRPADLATALRRRHSGGTLFRPVPGDLPVAALAAIARHVLAPYHSDLGPGPFCDVRLAVKHVEGVPAGIYRCDPDGTLRQLSDLLPATMAGLGAAAFGPPVTDYRAIGMLAYLSADRRTATDVLGNRGYRILNQDAGLVAQRLCLLAAGAGLAARPANGYTVPVVQELLGIEDPDRVPLFQIAVGRRSVSAQYEQPVVF